MIHTKARLSRLSQSVPNFFRLLAMCVTLLGSAAFGSDDTNIFRKAGIPSPDREWMGFDYTLAGKALASERVPLPRLSDPEGKKLLDRITSTNNLAFSRNKSLPVQIRITDSDSMMTAVRSILKRYLADAAKGVKVDSEITQLMAFVLHLTAAELDVADEFMAQVPKDEKFQTRAEGRAKMNSGVVTQFVGAANVLANPDQYNSNDRHVILSAMAATLPRLKKTFPPSYVGELKQKLIDGRPKITEPENALEIDSMLQTLGN